MVALLAVTGIVWQLEFGDFVMLQPEWINRYAAAVIRSVRGHLGEIGVIHEEDVLKGNLNYTRSVRLGDASGEDDGVESEPQRSPEHDVHRLPADEEAIVLRAMHQTFVDHGICVREHTPQGTELIFPSHFSRELPQDPGHPPVFVTYSFSGHLGGIYATLVVQLVNTKAFDSTNLWRYAADFRTPAGMRMGFKMTRRHEGAGEISVYFEAAIPDDVKVMFIKYIHEHLLEKAQDVVRVRHFSCPYCGHPVKDTELARQVLEQRGKEAQLRCQQPLCDKHFALYDLIEQKFASEEFQQRVRELEDRARAAIDNESKELILVGHAFSIAGEAGQIFRPLLNSDWGIDGEIEFKGWDGTASGKRIYLQLKSGDSYLYRRKDCQEVFTIKNERLRRYWQQQEYPVMLVIRTSDGEIRWMNVSAYLQENRKVEKGRGLRVVFDGEPFNAISVLRMRDRLIPSPQSALDK